jgi:DNA-binding IclR family transcriptional regulator
MDVKVLNKVFGLLEAVGARRGVPIQQRDLLRLVPGLTQATCARLLHSLDESGYVEALPGHRGYVLGPVAFWLGDGHRYQETLQAAAEGPLHGFTAATGHSVLLCVRRGHFRVILTGCNARGGVQLSLGLPRYHDLALCSTGRLLLSFMGPKARADYVSARGLPQGDPWPTHLTMHGFSALLDRIRAAGELRSHHAGRVAGAVPVPLPHSREAVLGCVWREEEDSRAERAMNALRAAASAIAANFAEQSNPVIE